MAGPNRNDPFGAFNFSVEIDGVTTTSFSEVSGLDAEIEPIEYRTGDEDITVRKIPGLRKYSNITLKRGFTPDLSLWNWMKQGLAGKVMRANMSITLLDGARQPVLRWNVREAWPCKWEGPDLNAKGNDIAIETLEICHEGIELVE
ncbi:MAG TPA: phage tail protein, partial [Vicinamibacterales bacterium]|nr:phage tail protein [Vicinamibacterales bacterium]